MNFLRTALLMAAMTALVMGVGFMLGGSGGVAVGFMIALAMNLFAYWSSGSMVLKMHGARPLDPGPIQTMITDIAARAGIPTPKAYLIDTPQPNAFATGRSPAHGAVAVTRGLVAMLNEAELRGVIAHEIAHIKHRDTLIMTVTATLAGALSNIASFAMFSRGGENRPHPIVGIALMILAPMAAMLVQMAISRTREYDADRAGALLTGEPLALANALQKIAGGAARIDNHAAENNPATAHLFIINPLHAHAVDGLFSTHPATHRRIAALVELAEHVRQGARPPLPKASTAHRRVRKGTFSGLGEGL